MENQCNTIPLYVEVIKKFYSTGKQLHIIVRAEYGYDVSDAMTFSMDLSGITEGDEGEFTREFEEKMDKFLKELGVESIEYAEELKKNNRPIWNIYF